MQESYEYVTKVDWNGKAIEVVQNEATGSFATLHPSQNIINDSDSKRCPPELLKQFSKEGKLANFNQDQILHTKGWCLGHYCELQSILSVQSIGWSVFGLTAHSPQANIEQWVSNLFEVTNFKNGTSKDAQLFLWRTLPNTNKKQLNKESIDAYLVTEDSFTAVIYYWADIHTNEEKEALRNRLEKLDELLHAESKNNLSNQRTMNILLINNNSEQSDIYPQHLKCNIYSASWSQICRLKGHPKQKELERYYTWKNNHSKAIESLQEQVA